MLYLFGSMEYMFAVAPAPRSIGLPWPNTTALISPTAQLDSATTSYTAPPLHDLFYRGFMVDVEAWSGCMSSLNQLVHHGVHCLPYA
jgi:hypothetical protein